MYEARALRVHDRASLRPHNNSLGRARGLRLKPPRRRTDTSTVRRLAVTLAAALACVLPAAAAAADKSWAEPQIARVVEAGLFAESGQDFQPQQRLTRLALADALAAAALQQDIDAPFRFPVLAANRPVTIRELDAALVGFVGLGDAARAVTAALRDAGLAPRAGAGTETVARLLGVRVNHPAAEDALELGPNDPSTRA